MSARLKRQLTLQRPLFAFINESSAITSEDTAAVVNFPIPIAPTLTVVVDEPPVVEQPIINTTVPTEAIITDTEKLSELKSDDSTIKSDCKETTKIDASDSVMDVLHNFDISDHGDFSPLSVTETHAKSAEMSPSKMLKSPQTTLKVHWSPVCDVSYLNNTVEDKPIQTVCVR